MIFRTGESVFVPQPWGDTPRVAEFLYLHGDCHDLQHGNSAVVGAGGQVQFFPNSMIFAEHSAALAMSESMVRAKTCPQERKPETAEEFLRQVTAGPFPNPTDPKTLKYWHDQVSSLRLWQAFNS